jgi:hypothetical protein
MADRPILFSAPMIRALLDGRKTQTRRVLKPQPDTTSQPSGQGQWGAKNRYGYWAPAAEIRPYSPGDRLWVREAFWTCEDCGYCNHVVGANSAGVGDRKCCAACDTMLPKPKTSPIFMPRYNSRLTLTVTNVRVQRLQDISEADAWAEGCKRGIPWDSGLGFFPAEEPHADGKSWVGWDDAREWFNDLWNSIHGLDAWDANPWVCAITFDVTQGNIDQIGVR